MLRFKLFKTLRNFLNFKSVVSLSFFFGNGSVGVTIGEGITLAGRRAESAGKDDGAAETSLVPDEVGTEVVGVGTCLGTIIG